MLLNDVADVADVGVDVKATTYYNVFRKTLNLTHAMLTFAEKRRQK